MSANGAAKCRLYAYELVVEFKTSAALAPGLEWRDEYLLNIHGTITQNDREGRLAGSASL